MLCSNTQVASSACWCASLAPWRALSCHWSLPQTWDGAQLGDWAEEWTWWPPLVFFQFSGTSPLSQAVSQGRQDSLVAFSIHSGPHGSGLGSLFSRYTLWKRFLTSSWEVLYPTSWITGMSASGFSLGRLCQWPQQIILSASFCPDWAAHRNIPWRITGQCSPPTSQSWYSSQEHLCVHMMLCFPYGQPISPHPLFSSQQLMQLISVVKF